MFPRFNITGRAQAHPVSYCVLHPLVPKHFLIFHKSVPQKKLRLISLQFMTRTLEPTKPENAFFQNFLGTLRLEEGDSQAAMACFQKAVALNPGYAEAQMNLGRILKARGDWVNARPAFEQAAKANTSDAESCYQWALSADHLKHFDEAENAYRETVSRAPDHALAWCALGVLLKQQDRLDSARDCYFQSIALNPRSANGWYNLALVLESLDEPTYAELCYRKVLALDGSYIQAHNNLGVLLKQAGRLEDARNHYLRALAIDEEFAQAQFNMALVYEQEEQIDSAIDWYRKAIATSPQFSAAHNNLCILLKQSGRREEAIVAYRQALEANPDNETARHMLSAQLGETTESAPPGYVRALFNGYSRRFEKHLNDALEYRTPSALLNLWTRSHPCPPMLQNLVDLGCGTGLAGMQFRDHARRLVGLDLSSGMIAEARKKQIYDELQESEIIEFLSDHPDTFDGFLAADVFNYFGNLHPLFEGICRASRKQGAWLIFSVESLSGSGYQLGPHGRFAHSNKYVHTLAQQTGLEVFAHHQENLRKEKGQWVEGLVYIMKIIAC